MSKVKVPRKSTYVDMTAMTDVAFLLLTFFMLATKFKPEEPVLVDTPSSISEIKLPESDIMLISISKDGRVFFGSDGQPVRAKVLVEMGKQYQITFTPEEIKQFSLIEQFGVPIANLKQYLATEGEARSKFPQPGIPSDSAKNELSDWIWQTRLANNDVRVAVKGDKDSNYPVVKQVIATLQERKVNRFNFITSMESANQ